MIRGFIAVDLSDDVRIAVGEAQERLKPADLSVKVSWSNVANLHLTLQFLGDVEEMLVPQVSAALGSVASRHGAFDLAIAGAGVFPDARRPRVLWVGCDDVGGRLKALAGGVQTAMQSFGFEPEHREFAAHLTLGRIKFPRPDAALTRALDSLKTQSFGTMRVDRVHLCQSQLHPHGSIYTKISSHTLRGDTEHGRES